ncbi:hypothetical protein Pcinc_016598 [Petrolisthes cinctipes]|uniref:Uncharacterized protein n=1 Tax=Petrolisthes cinctipes TaxID=88211 RepID=A0AAE1FQS2_PETCI|nr:hypothetical protein Pcinc_016598 [Petrolisthes cinctipes]
MIVIFFSHLGTKSLKKNLKRKVGPSTSKCSVEVDPSVVTKKRKLSQHISFHQLPESAKEVMDSGPFEFTEVTKHCSDYNMLEEERMRVKVEQCNDKEKLEDGRMKVKIEDCSDDKFEEERMKVKVEDCSDYDMLEEERMKVKIEDCTDEDVIVKVEHDIDEDDESKRVKKTNSSYIRKCHETGGGPCPTPPKLDELTLLAESVMQNDLQPALEQLDSVDVESCLEGINCTVGTDGTLQFEASDGELEELGLARIEEKLPSLVDEAMHGQSSKSCTTNSTKTATSRGSSFTTPSRGSSPATVSGCVSVKNKIQRKRKISDAKSEAITKLHLEQTAHRERISSVLETELRKVSNKACEFMDGILECCRMITTAVVKKIEECPPEAVLKNIKDFQ